MDEKDIEEKCSKIWDKLTEKYGSEELTSNEFKIRIVKEITGIDDEESELIMHSLFVFIDKIMIQNVKNKKESDMIYK